MIFYKDLLSLSEEQDITVQEALEDVVYINSIPTSSVVVAVEEWRPPIDEQCYQFDNIVLFKEGTNSLPYKICNEIMTNYFSSGEDPYWLDVLSEAIFDEDFALSVLDEDQYHMSTNSLQNMVNRTQKRLNNMGVNDPQRAQLQTDLKNMQSALTVRNNMAKSRASDRSGMDQYGQARTSNDQMTKAEQNARKAEIQTRLDANQNAPKPNLTGTGDPAAKIKSALGSPNNPRPTPTPPPQPPQQNQSWISRMWSGLKNWFSNTFGNSNASTATPENKYAAAGANVLQGGANNLVDRLVGWLSNWAQNHDMNLDPAIRIGGQYAKEKVGQKINQVANTMSGS
jgi:hypothetical protein